MPHSSTSLFLHWGPGSNASIERAWFGPKPSIHWWDQPNQFKNPALSFDEIVDAALQELNRLKASTSRPVRLLAHSFGGQIALELARLAPASISEITLISSAPTPMGPFIRLASHLSRVLAPTQPEASRNLASLSKKVDQSHDVSEFWQLIGSVAQIEGFFLHYWHENAALKRYLEISPQGPPIDMSAFQTILASRLSKPLLPTAPIAGLESIPVQLYWGKHDPLLDLKEDKEAWRKIAPRIQIHEVDSGHFVHFERPEALSLGASGPA